MKLNFWKIINSFLFNAKNENKVSKDRDGSIPISVIDYTKKFRKFVATKNVSFNVNKGVIHGFIGPNGSGKTTVIKAMMGAYIPTHGSIYIGKYKAGSVEANRLIGYIPERASFPKQLNCLQYLTTMGELSGLKTRFALKKAKEILTNLNLIKQAKRKPYSFSSGMQKKILLAQALLTNPEILILDEPAANLDPSARKELFNDLIKLRNEGKTILISSHILAELERLIDEVTFIYYGDIIYTGKTSDIESLSKIDIFIKSVNNKKLVKHLLKKGYKIGGDEKTEIVIKDIKKSHLRKVFDEVTNSKIDVSSYRANDLQSVYDALVAKALKDNSGKQTLAGKKTFTVAENEEDLKITTKSSKNLANKNSIKKVR